MKKKEESFNLKQLKRLIYGRTLMVALLFILQLILMAAGFMVLSEYLIVFVWVSAVLGIGVVMYLINNDSNPMVKLSWMIPVLVIPFFGILVYLFINVQPGVRKIDKRHQQMIRESRYLLNQDEDIAEQLAKEDALTASMCAYVSDYGGYPVYKNTTATYFPIGEDMFEALKTQLKTAEHFIFMEFFIVAFGEMWSEILEILKAKAQAGVEVLFMYDGMCSLALLPYEYPKYLQGLGIQCKMFAPVKPILSTSQNNRDHRKIVVIDGKTAFTGGINLADEYINKLDRFGHWKDTGIMLQGDAVNGFSMMFLQMWNISEKQTLSYEAYFNKTALTLPQEKTRGYVLAYGDSPWDKEQVAEHIYMDMINQAVNYVHIMTPYLIIDNEMQTALIHAAKRGVETIIMMPHIPDKKLAYWVARTYYPTLIGAGVEIYEYTPGFVHAKVMVADGQKATVGTVNLDFRSLYLHFECGTFMYRHPEIKAIEEDFQKTLVKCQHLTLADCKKFPLHTTLIGSALRIFGPLM